jgi:hypothetical protein
MFESDAFRYRLKDAKSEDSSCIRLLSILDDRAL